jgi:peptide/nickel transport system ATP-binding protein
MDDVVLEVRDLRTHFFTAEGVVRAVDGLSARLRRRETLAIVGESGCGKTVTAYSILKLVPDPPGKIIGGQVLLEGKDLIKLGPEEICDVRGKDIAMIFQEPMTSLNPVFTVGYQVAEAILRHERVSGKEAWNRAVELFRLVGIPAPEKRIREYPHQLSGGMRQRVMIAVAIACRPKVLIADEPTTALDVTTQAQVLELIVRLKEEFGMGMILITHDLGVVAETAQQVIVMYAGKKVEEAPVLQLFDEPLHPYTQCLFECVLRIDSFDSARPRLLREIEGLLPSVVDLPTGCAFAPRCQKAVDRCRKEEPELREVRPGHWVSCFVAQSNGGHE